METGPTGTQVCVCVSAKPFNDNRKRPALKRYNILRRLEIEPRYSQRSLELFFTTFRPFLLLFVSTWRQKCSKHSRQPKSAQSAALFFFCHRHCCSRKKKKEAAHHWTLRQYQELILQPPEHFEFCDRCGRCNCFLVGAVNRSHVLAFWASFNFMQHPTLQQ